MNERDRERANRILERIGIDTRPCDVVRAVTYGGPKDDFLWIADIYKRDPLWCVVSVERQIRLRPIIDRVGVTITQIG